MKFALILFFLSCIYSVNAAPTYRYMLMNENGTANMYFIDFIEISNPKYIMDNDRNLYMISNYDSTINVSKKSPLLDKDTFLVCQNLYDDMFFIYLDQDELEHYEQLASEYTGFTRKLKPIKTNRINSKLSTVEFEQEAKIFMFFLMTGELYNHYKYEIHIDGGEIDRPLKFPDPKAYYKVVVPIWEPSPKKQSNDN